MRFIERTRNLRMVNVESESYNRCAKRLEAEAKLIKNKADADQKLRQMLHKLRETMRSHCSV